VVKDKGFLAFADRTFMDGNDGSVEPVKLFV